MDRDATVQSVDEPDVDDLGSSPLIEGAGCVGCVYSGSVLFTRCCFLPPNPYTLAC